MSQSNRKRNLPVRSPKVAKPQKCDGHVTVEHATQASPGGTHRRQRGKVALVMHRDCESVATHVVTYADGTVATLCDAHTSGTGAGTVLGAFVKVERAPWAPVSRDHVVRYA